MYTLRSLLILIVGTHAFLEARSASIGADFIAVNASNIRGSLFSVPYNPTCAVGLSQFITTCYGATRSFSTTSITPEGTLLPDGALDIDTNAFIGTNGINDNWLIYHIPINRYILSGENSDVTFLQYAISDSGQVTPASQWTLYTIPAADINPSAPDGTLDFQQPAFDSNAWYNGVGTFDSSGNFLGSSLVVIPNSSLLAGNPHISVFPELLPNLNILQEGFACPATNFDPNPTYGYIACLVYDAPNYTTGSTIQLYRVSDTATTNPQLGPLVTFDATPFASNAPAVSHKGNLFGAVGNLQVTSPAFGTGVHVRNKQLYLVTDSQMDSAGNADANGDRYGIIWWRFDLTGDATGQGRGDESPSTVPVLVQTGKIFDTAPTDPLNYYMVSIMTNTNSDILLSFNTSGNNAYVNTAYAFYAATTPIQTPVTLTPIPVTDTQFPLNFNYNVSELPGPNVQRWGDQSCIVVDPTNPANFWLIQPFAALQNAWGLRATQIVVQ